MPFQFIEVYPILNNAKEFVKRQVIGAVRKSTQLCSVDVKDTANILPLKDIDKGFRARSTCKSSKDINVIST